VADHAQHLAVYGRLALARVRGELQYRGSFALFTASQFLASALDFVALLAVFGHIDALAGWSVAEVAFLYGSASLSFHLCDLVFGQVEHLSERIRTGTFDRLLTRPLGVLGQLLAEEFALRRVGKVAQAAVVFAVAVAWVEVDWDAGRLLWLPLMLVAGSAIFAAVWVALGTVAFWTTEGGGMTNAFTYGGHYLAQHPLGIYGRWLRRLALVVPVAFVNYYPALYVLGRSDTLGLPPAARFASPAVAAAAGLLATRLWRTGVRHYRSTGS
jgi:ABC-2 type transport system permease protein